MQVVHIHLRLLLFTAALAWAAAPAVTAGQSGRATGLELIGLPVLKVDSDEGVTYGALTQLYQYGDGSSLPYVWVLQPEVQLSTEGRRDAGVPSIN